MPSKSEKQHILFEAAAHNKEFADKNGIDQKVAREYIDADKAYRDKTGHQPWVQQDTKK